MIQTNKSYVYGTAAEKLKYDVYKENKILKGKKKARSNNKGKLKTICIVLTVFVFLFIIMQRYARITELNYNIYSLNKKYEDTRNENSRLKIEIEKSTDLNKIKEIAEERLKMQKPDRYQIVFVRVPKSDLTVVADTYKSDRAYNESVFAMLLNKLSRFIGLLY